MTAVTRKLHYPGNCTGIVGQILGPNMIGEWLEVVDATYDPAADITTATLRYARQGAM